MENVRVVQSDDEGHILAFCNPEDMKKLGLSTSGMKAAFSIFGQAGFTSAYANKIMDNIIMPYFKENCGGEYNEYMPLFANFHQMPDDMVLPVIELFSKNNIDQNGQIVIKKDLEEMQTFWETETERYIEDYLEEKKQIETEQKTSVSTVIVKVKDINTVLHICRYVPIKYCVTGRIIKYENQYYLTLDIEASEKGKMSLNMAAMMEFGEIQKNRILPELKEHGDVIVDDISRILTSELVK